MFDKDGDGTISVDELTIVLRSIGQNPSAEEVLEIIKEVGQEVDGEMVCGFDEFLLLMSKNLNDEQMDEEMMEVFKTFDQGNKEYIDIKDLKRVLKGYQENLTEEEMETLFKGTDEDQDGKINFRDFILMMMAK